MTVEYSFGSAQQNVADIYNSAIAAWAVGAAWELGALDELYDRGDLDADQFAERHDLHQPSMIGMCRALAAVDIVKREGSIIKVSRNFDEVYRNKAFFHWLGRGSSELFRQMPTMMRAANRVGDFFQRDSAAIAYACREIDAACYAPTFWEAIKRLDFKFSTVVDLGCGSGGRLLELLDHYPEARGIGVDLARPALEDAREELGSAGLVDRVEFIEGDVLRLEPHPRFEEVELITCFMMGHDFWPRETCIATLRNLRRVFPQAKRFLLGDATRSIGIADEDLPVFTLGFEFGHDLMGTFIPTLEDWMSVFAEGGWNLARTHRINTAVGETIFELS